MAEQRLGLVHENFAAQAGATLSSLFEDTTFTDVTLVAEDHRQIQVHKVVLSSGSGFFRQILLHNPHPKPLIYLKQKFEDLQAIVRFIYMGRCDVDHGNIEVFLNIAKDLDVVWLSQRENEKQNNEVEKLFGSTHFEEEPLIEEAPSLTENDIDIKEDSKDLSDNSCSICILSFSDILALKEHIKLNHGKSWNHGKDGHLCNICSKTLSTSTGLKYHIKHVHDVSKKESDEIENKGIMMHIGDGMGRKQAYDDKDFAYKIRHTKQNLTYYSCFSKSCPARVVVTKDWRIVQRKNEHNHGPMSALLRVRRVESEAMEEMLEEPSSASGRALVAAIAGQLVTPEMEAYASSPQAMERKLLRKLAKIRQLQASP